MSAEETKARWRRFVEAWGKGWAAYTAALDELFAPDFVIHNAYGKDIHGLENFKQGVKQVFDNFPDFHGTVEDIVVEGDKVAWRYTETGTHKVTNKTVRMWAIGINRVVGGKIVEAWQRADTLGVQQQLGLIPTPKKE